MRGGGALGVLAAEPASAVRAGRSPPLDFTNPRDNLYGLLKLMGSIDGRRTHLVQPGRIYASRPGELTRPLLDYTGVTVREIRRASDDVYLVRYRGWMVWHDLQTGDVIDEWKNPLSGVTQPTQDFVTEIGSQRFTANGLARPKGYSGAFNWFDRPFVLPWQTMGDDTWVPYEQFSMYRNTQGAARYEGAIHTYHGSLAAVRDRSRASAPATIASQSESPWYPWMKLDNVPGHLILRSLGRKFLAIGDMPADAARLIETRYPGGLHRPLPWGEL